LNFAFGGSNSGVEWLNLRANVTRENLDQGQVHLTIHDVARLAKVSTATVSRAINQSGNVKPELARRVRRAIAEIQYYPNTQARAMRSGKSRILGLVVPDITDPVSAAIVQSFESMASVQNYETLLTTTGNNPERTTVAIRHMMQRSVDGIAVLALGVDERLIEELQSRRVPLVFLDMIAPIQGMNSIRIDYMHGTRQAVQHLAARRHTRIAYVSGPLRHSPTAARVAEFRKCLDEIQLKLQPDLIIEGDDTIAGGMRALAAIQRLVRRPTAVLCSNDMTAIGVILKAREQGISIPADLSVVGFDNISLSQFTEPALTTIQWPQASLAERALRMLCPEVKKPVSPAVRGACILPTDLLIRASTSMAPRI
jgi:LacI family transcriptional regulator